MADIIARPTALEQPERLSGGGLVGDAPPDADAVLASIRVWPRWLGALLAAGASGALWGGIVVGVRWALHVLS